MKNLFLKLAFVSASVLTFQCKESDPLPQQEEEDDFINPIVAKVYLGTQSPGDVWEWTLDPEQKHMLATWDYGTFDDTSDDITVKGTYEELPSGFIKVTITESIPVHQEIPTDGSAWFYAIEVPGMTMLVKPEGSIKGDLIAMVPKGSCEIDGTYNYVVTAPGERSAYDPIIDEAFGYVEFNQNGSNHDISGYKFSLDCLNEGNCSDTGLIEGLPQAICEGDGRIRIADGGQTMARGQFTSGGVMMLDRGYGNGGVFALKTNESATKAALNNNTYTGIAYLPKDQENTTLPVKIDFFTNSLDAMIGSGYPFTSLENSLVSTEAGVTVLIDEVINGRVLGTMNFDEDNTVSSMAGAYLIQGENEILILSSFSENNGEPFILVLTKTN